MSNAYTNITNKPQILLNIFLTFWNNLLLNYLEQHYLGG